MADVINPFADWKPPGEKSETSATKKGVEVENPFEGWESPKKPKEGTKENPLKGAVEFADKAMGAIGVDLRTESGTTRKPKNWLEEQGQNIAKTSREEVNEQREVRNPVKALGGKVLGAATGIPRFAEDAKNASKGIIYGAGEAAKPVLGVNPVQRARDVSKQFSSEGNPAAPALAATMELLNLSEPTHYGEEVTKRLGKATGLPATIESGQGNILNAVPVGVGGNVARKGIGAMYRAGVEAGAAMGLLTGAQVAGRETAQTGKSFNPQNVAREAAKSAIVGGVGGGIVHGAVTGFSKVPKSLGRKPEAHARDTVVSTTPIEPGGIKPKTKGDKAFKEALDAQATLDEAQALLDSMPGAQGDLSAPLPPAVAPGVKQVLKNSKALGRKNKQSDAELARRIESGAVTEKSPALSQGELPRPSEIEASRSFVKEADRATSQDRADAMKGRVDSVRRGFDRKEKMHATTRHLQAEERVNIIRRGLDAQEKVAKVREIADRGYEQPATREEIRGSGTPIESVKPVKSTDLDQQMIGDRNLEDWKKIYNDKANKTAEERRQAKLEIKKAEKAQKKATKEDAGALPGRYKKAAATEPPPEAPKAPPPREEGVITRAEFKRRTVQSRTATPEEVGRYSKVAEAVAEHDYHQRRYEAGLKQLAEEMQVQAPTKMMTGSHEKALSPESGELNQKVAAAISKMRELAGHSDAPTIDVYDKTFMGEHKIEPLTGKTPQEKWAELEGIKREADRWKGEADSETGLIKGEWKSKVEPAYKVEDKTYVPVKVTASDGTNHFVNVIVKDGAKKVMTASEARNYAVKDVQSRYGAVKEGAHPRAVSVPTSRGDVLLESYKRKPSFTKSELAKAEARAGNDPAFQAAKKEYEILKPKRDSAGEYEGVNYPELHKVLAGEIKKFFTSETGSGVNLVDFGIETGKQTKGVVKDISDIWATHVINKNKKALEDFLADREVQREFQGSSEATKMQRLGDVLRTALAQKNDMDWVKGYSPELHEGLIAIRSQMENLGQGVKQLDNSLAAREEFAEAVDMTPQAVRDRQWEHLTKDQANFIADISELRSEAADMISDTWDVWNDEGRTHSFEARHMENLFGAYTGGVDIRTGLRVPKKGYEKVIDHLMTGAYDAMVTGNKRIHSLHVIDALTMGTSVVHPTNLARAAYEFATNREVRHFLASYQGTGVYKQTRGSKMIWYEKNIGKAIELSAERVFGKRGLEALKKLEGSWVEKYKIDFIRGAAILRAGKEMGYKGNALQDLAREFASGKTILSPVEHTELQIRVLNQLEDAFGYNPAGFVNRNAFRQLGVDRLFPFMGIRSVQNRLFGKFIAERNMKGLATLSLATWMFAGSNALMLPFENALQFAAPEQYIQLKHLMDFVSLAGFGEAGLRATGAMNDENEQNFAPFLRRIEHIQPEVVPWLYNPPEVAMDVFNFKDGWTNAKTTVALSALFGGSSIAGITTPTELEAFWRRMEKGAEKEKNLGVYQRQPFGEKRLSTKKHVPTTYFREFMNHLLPQADAIDERYASEAKFGAAVKTQLMRNGYDAKEIKSIMNHFYRPIHKAGRVADSHDFLELLHEHPKK